jgi:RNA polymerase sigma-70 factor (ECF subfamily)
VLDDQTFLEFIERIRAGDEQAATELVSRYEPLIRREVRLHLDDRNLIRLFDSMDICQSVLASFFVRTAAGEYDIGSSTQLVKLLVSMARNKLISAARREYMQRRDVRRRKRHTDPALEEIAEQRQEPVEELANRELLGRIYDRLSPEELQISKLRSSGAAWEEVASEMGGTSQSRRMQFSRAIDRVAEQLGVDLA